MKCDNLIIRTKTFASECVKLAMLLPNNYLGNHVRGQLFRSSTSVACNYRAVCHAQSKASFISKLSIVIEEADETEYWLEFITDENLIVKKNVEMLKKEATELTSIFVASRKTARRIKGTQSFTEYTQSNTEK